MERALLLLTSSFAIAASGALARGNTDACHDQYGSSMERCITRPQGMQDACLNSCEASTNQCYAGMYGNKSSAPAVPPALEQASAAAQQPEPSVPRKEAKPTRKRRNNTSRQDRGRRRTGPSSGVRAGWPSYHGLGRQNPPRPDTVAWHCASVT